MLIAINQFFFRVLELLFFFLEVVLKKEISYQLLPLLFKFEVKDQSKGTKEDDERVKDAETAVIWLAVVFENSD